MSETNIQLHVPDALHKADELTITHDGDHVIVQFHDEYRGKDQSRVKAEDHQVVDGKLILSGVSGEVPPAGVVGLFENGYSDADPVPVFLGETEATHVAVSANNVGGISWAWGSDAQVREMV